MTEWTLLSAYLAGQIAGRLTDPIGITAVITAAYFGFSRSSRWTIVGVAAAGTAITLPFVWQWWTEAGLLDRWITKSVWIGVTFLIVSIIGYFVGVFLSKLRSSSRPT